MANTPITSHDKQIKELRKYLRQSKAAIPGVLIFGGVCLAILLLVDWFVTVRWWIYASVLWVVPFGLIGDGVNIIYFKRKLARLERESANTTRPQSGVTA